VKFDFDNTPFENVSAIYPQPIALSCGRICRARNSQEQLDALLKCAETITRYLAVVAISSFSAREDANIDVPKGLSNFVGNLSFGHFLSVVQGIADINTSHPLKDALTAAFKSKEGGSGPADASLSKLLKLRNQLGHGLESISEAKATSIFLEHSPNEDLKIALETLDPIFRFPMFVVEEQRVESKKYIARRLLLMGESEDPLPEEIEINTDLERIRSPYIGLPDGVLCLYPFLIWELVKVKANYSIYFIQSIPEKNLKYTTINSDDWEHNSELHNQIQERISGVIFPKEIVLLKNGSSFLKEWLEKKRAIEQSRLAISGYIPWNELNNGTVRWYALQLGASVSDTDEKIHRIMSKQLFDGRERLTPEEIRQVILLFGRELVIKKLLTRNMIDCRARKNPNLRWDERLESAGNVLECLKMAIDFFGRHVGVDGTTLEGLKATAGSADYIAMREGLVNLFIHQDYGDSTTVAQIEITQDQTMFFNAGRSLVSSTALVDGGKSQSRNPLISRALRLIGFAELAGSGLREVHRAWREAKRYPPNIESNPEANTFTLTLDWRELPVIADEFWKKRLGVTLTPQESKALLLSSSPSGTSVEEIASSQGINVSEAAEVCKSLLRNALVVEKDNRVHIQEHLRQLAEEAKTQAE
jgi:predicted HTH transcriptional regulator